MEEITYDKLEKKVWDAKSILPMSLDSTEYKNYIFSMVFFKRLSDVFEEEAENDTSVSHNSHEGHQIFVPELARWESIRKLTSQIGDTLNKVIAELENENHMMKGLLEIDFNSDKLGDVGQRDRILMRLIQHFSTIPMKNSDFVKPDSLRRLYVKTFVDDAEKKGDRVFYLPIMQNLKILEPKGAKNVLS